MAKTKKKPSRRTYSPERRAQILGAAKKERLTAAAVQKRFGVKPVTFYSWRKKRGGSRRVSGGGDGRTDHRALGDRLRGEVQARLRQLLPEIVRSEVGALLASAFGRQKPGRGSRA